MKKIIEVFIYFLKLGATGFGGPVALVGIMQKDLVEDAKWVELDKFKKVLPLLKSMPGAFSFQTAVYLGQEYAGRWGGFIAGLALVFPASVMMIILGIVLKNFGQNQEVKYWIQGFQWGALLLMLLAALNLVKSHLREINFWIFMFLASLMILIFNVNELLLIFLVGLIALMSESKFVGKKLLSANFIGSAVIRDSLVGTSAVGSLFLIDQLPSFKNLFLICFSSGAFVFGTGIAIAPMLEKFFVVEYHWISHEDFISALSLSQMTPGPVLVIVTLIGYKILGLKGAILATFGVYLPGWINILTWFPKVADKLIKNKLIQYFLKGALAAVVITILSSIVQLSLKADKPILGVVIVGSLFFANTKIKISSWLLIILAGVIYRLSLFALGG